MENWWYVSIDINIFYVIFTNNTFWQSFIFLPSAAADLNSGINVTVLLADDGCNTVIGSFQTNRLFCVFQSCYFHYSEQCEWNLQN